MKTLYILLSFLYKLKAALKIKSVHFSKTLNIHTLKIGMLGRFLNFSNSRLSHVFKVIVLS